jgi:predicted oxidoreductase
MEKIYLSDSGPKVSPAIYGFYRWKEEDVTHLRMEQMIHFCLENGINTFDHADIYGGYTCEESFGEVLRKSSSIKREDIVIFSKCGLNIPHPSQPHIRVRHYDTTGSHVQKSIDQSLKRLNTEYIDIYLLNGADPLSGLEETAYILQKVRETGKIKNIGVVNFNVFQHQRLSAYLDIPIVTNHIELNLLNTTAFDNGQIDYVKQRYMRPLATSPLAAGVIAESTEKRPLRIRGKLEELGEKHGVHFESVAIAWLLKIGALPLIGSVNFERIKHIVKAFDISLEHQDWYELYEASKN